MLSFLLKNKEMKNKRIKPKFNPRIIERAIYILIISALCVFAFFKDSDSAEKLIRAVTNAFTIIINTQ